MFRASLKIFRKCSTEHDQRSKMFGLKLFMDVNLKQWRIFLISNLYLPHVWQMLVSMDSKSVEFKIECSIYMCGGGGKILIFKCYCLPFPPSSLSGPNFLRSTLWPKKQSIFGQKHLQFAKIGIKFACELARKSSNGFKLTSNDQIQIQTLPPPDPAHSVRQPLSAQCFYEILVGFFAIWAAIFFCGGEWRHFWHTYARWRVKIFGCDFWQPLPLLKAPKFWVIVKIGPSF